MIPLLDTHQHLIYPEHVSYAWTNQCPPLANQVFPLETYEQLTEGLEIAATLFMEVDADDADYKKEARLIKALSHDPRNSIAGVIASIRPELDEGFDAWLEESIALGVVGYRRVLHVVDDSVSQSTTFRANIAKIGAVGKPFDLCFLARQLPLAYNLAAACANTQFILNHCGVPDITAGKIEPWRDNIKKISELENISCKLSGIMAYCAPGTASLETIKPYIDHILECFGPERIVWGSDWPLVNLANGLPDWITITRTILADLAHDEARAIAHINAIRIYNISSNLN